MRFTDNASITSANMANDDILAGTDVSASADKKFSLANIADWLLNKFNGLSLAGSQQTVKSALDSLNSNLMHADRGTIAITSGQNLNDFVTVGTYYCSSATVAASLVNCPLANSGFKLVVEAVGYPDRFFVQTIYVHSAVNAEMIYKRAQSSPTERTWYEWQMMPTRAEMDAATAATTVTQLRNTDLNTLTEPMRVYYAGGSHGCTNVPASAASFGLIVLQISSGYRAQICISSGLNVYIRRYASDTWGTWFEFAKSAIS